MKDFQVNNKYMKKSEKCYSMYRFFEKISIKVANFWYQKGMLYNAKALGFEVDTKTKKIKFVQTQNAKKEKENDRYCEVGS